MERTAFIETVSHRADVDEPGAEDATRAALATLGERLSEDQATDLAAELPADLAEPLAEGASGERFSEEEFVSRIDQRLDTVELTGERAATAVLGVLLEAVDDEERDAVVDQFDHYGYDDLLTETEADVGGQERSPREY